MRPLTRSFLLPSALLATTLLLIPAPALAAPLVFKIATSNSLVTANTAVIGNFDVEPDLTDTFPAPLIATTTTNTRPRGNIEVDVPLVNPAGQTLTFTGGSIIFPAVGRATGGGIVTFPFAPLPGLGIGGVQPVAFTFDLGDLELQIDPPFTTTPLFRTGPKEWRFAALATFVVSGNVGPELLIPTIDPVVLGPVPIEPTAVVLPIVGTIADDPGGTTLTIGLDDAVDSIELALDIETLEFTLLPGVVELSATLDATQLGDVDLAIEATNPARISAEACGLGAELALLGLLGRRRLHRALARH